MSAVATPSTGWRPPQWSQPALTTLTVPGTPVLDLSGSTNLPNNLPGATGFVYSLYGAIDLNHESELTVTQHPVQTGANVNDHAYQNPQVVRLKLLMSDAMAYPAGQWTGGPSQSVNAFQTLLGLQSGRTLCTLTTRLQTYSNMIVQGVHATDSVETRYGLDAIITFRQIILASVTATSSSLSFGSDATGTPVSARPQTTDTTSVGTAQTSTPSAPVVAQHTVTAAQTTPAAVPGSGTISSNNTSSLPTYPVFAGIP